jgi:predicted kinase
MPTDASGGVGRLFVLCGLPGSGKTTLAIELAARHRAVRMCPDEWMPALGIDLWDADARMRVEALQGELTRSLLLLGTNVVIEWGVWARVERDALRAAAREIDAAVELRYLEAPIDVLFERIARRDAEGKWAGRSITRAELDQWSTIIEVPSADELALFDPPLRDA